MKETLLPPSPPKQKEKHSKDYNSLMKYLPAQLLHQSELDP
jgi:hypothetical protein